MLLDELNVFRDNCLEKNPRLLMIVKTKLLHWKMLLVGKNVNQFIKKGKCIPSKYNKKVMAVVESRRETGKSEFVRF